MSDSGESSYLETSRSSPESRIRGLSDVYEPRLREGQAITGQTAPAYSDYQALLDRAALDAVVVATPTNLHREHVVAALESGRHVYGEKPLGYSARACSDIVATVRRTGRHFQIGQQLRYALQLQYGRSGGRIRSLGFEVRRARSS